VVRLGCSEASTENTREEGKQVVKRNESGLIPCPFISCVKANTKSGVGIDRGSLYILSISDRAIGERAVATGVVTPEVAKGWLRDRNHDGRDSAACTWSWEGDVSVGDCARSHSCEEGS
jgi:hypothetical protein